ncbi:E3 ubiquitin-protein ligase TRIM47-like [Cavia porcellus]|uniref:E3 ubiquitin-protein ligase TRIM47-like n=1 Tax=Cavia porcellus TaxID=10141 RepID=UPI002FE3E7D2
MADQGETRRGGSAAGSLRPGPRLTCGRRTRGSALRCGGSGHECGPAAGGLLQRHQGLRLQWRRRRRARPASQTRSVPGPHRPRQQLAGSRDGGPALPSAPPVPSPPCAPIPAPLWPPGPRCCAPPAGGAAQGLTSSTTGSSLLFISQLRLSQNRDLGFKKRGPAFFLAPRPAVWSLHLGLGT